MRRNVALDIKRLVEIQSYRGFYVGSFSNFVWFKTDAIFRLPFYTSNFYLLAVYREPSNLVPIYIPEVSAFCAEMGMIIIL